MNCPRCGKPAAAGSAFCPHCGSALPRIAVQPTPRPRDTQAVATAGVASLQADFDAQRRKTMIIGGVIAAMVLVGGLIFGIRAFNGLRANAGSPDLATTRVNGKVPAPVLRANANSGPPVLAQNAEKPAPKVMPADVLEWLRHLERCEAMKVTITGDQNAEMMALLPKIQALGPGMGLQDPYDQSQDGAEDQDPGSYTKGKMLDLRPRWEELVTYFNSKRPPAECKPIADDFNTAIGEIPGMVGDIADVLNQISSAGPQAALSAAQKLKSKSYGEIDRYFARTDQKVQQICDKYETRKWFNIKTDVSTGGMLGSFSGASGIGGPTGISGAGGL